MFVEIRLRKTLYFQYVSNVEMQPQGFFTIKSAYTLKEETAMLQQCISLLEFCLRRKPRQLYPSSAILDTVFPMSAARTNSSREERAYLPELRVY